MTEADLIIEQLRAGHDRLAVVVAGLDGTQLAQSSGAREWTVADVLGHLGSGAEIALAVLDSALTGKDAPGPDFNPSVWDRWNAMSPTEKAAGFIAADESLVSQYEAIDPATRESFRIDLGFLPAPVDLATLAGMRLSEFTLHAWDVDVAFDPTATLPTVAAGILQQRHGMLIAWVSKPDKIEPRPVAVRVETTDPTGEFDLSIADSVSLANAAAAAETVLRIPAEAWVRLVAGRLSPEHTPDGIEISGGQISLTDLRALFPGY